MKLVFRNIIIQRGAKDQNKTTLENAYLLRNTTAIIFACAARMLCE